VQNTCFEDASGFNRKWIFGTLVSFQVKLVWFCCIHLSGGKSLMKACIEQWMEFFYCFLSFASFDWTGSRALGGKNHIFWICFKSNVFFINTHDPTILLDKGLTLEISASLSLHGGSLIFVNLCDILVCDFPTGAAPEFL